MGIPSGAASTEEAVALLSQSANAWGLEMTEAGRVSDAMFTAVRLIYRIGGLVV